MRRDTYTLMVSRDRKRKGKTVGVTEWLKAPVRGTLEDVTVEAESLLEDPRDDIKRVLAWSERKQQFMSYVWRRKEGDGDHEN